jgi:hypothetical protein
MKKKIQIILDAIAIINLLIAIIWPIAKLFILALASAGIAMIYRHFNKKEDNNGE